MFKPDQDNIKINILSKFDEDWFKIWMLEWSQDCTKILHSHLLFVLPLFMFKLDKDFAQINILSKLHKNCIKIMASEVETRFY